MIAQLQKTIETRLQEALTPAVAVELYPQLVDGMSLPRVALELDEFAPGTDPGNNQLALIATMQARVILDPNQEDAELLIRQLAARVALEVHRAYGFDLGYVAPAKIRRLVPDGFSRPELEGYLVWLVEWTHEIDIGDEADLTVRPGAAGIDWTVMSGDAEEELVTV
ncbi:hypothetical protein LQR30_15610 [Chromobacterium piscinae]|uniref:hypothetical protein n=1 Tax=Chromobacterium piscinae TaxID=686831 RepID=UPI001E3FCC99|nr:hypothetical protein [Chromobacterium piscinae]MCD4505525.1 hypothetical protein [Chromobacterium piscinae]